MNRYLSPRARGVAAALAVLMGLTLTAPPAALAGSPEKPQAKVPLVTVADAKVAATVDQAVTAAPTQDTAGGGGGGSKPFFKSPAGIAALVLMAGATGWVIQSRLSDNVVHSPGKK